MNSRKGVAEDVLDPFQIETGWFRLEFVTFRVSAASELPDERRHKVEATIRRLGLNEMIFRDARTDDYQVYCDHRDEPAGWTWLLNHNPFVAAEVARQGLRRPDDA